MGLLGKLNDLMWAGRGLAPVERAPMGSLPQDLSPTDGSGRMLAGILPGGAGFPPKRGTQQFLESYNTFPWFRAVVARIGDAVAATHWQLFVVRPGGPGKKAIIHRELRRGSPERRKALMDGLRDRGDLEEVIDHPFLTLLDSANEYHTGKGVWKVSQISIETIGEFFWLKERNGLGAPVSVWPIPAHWVLQTPTPTNRFFRVSFRAWQGLIPETEMFWGADLDPAQPYGRGTGVGQALADELETDKYAALHTRQMFFNQMKPDLLITAKDLSDADTRRLERDWTQRHQGFWRAFKAHFLNKEVQVHEFSNDLRANQFVQLRQHERDMVTQVFGVPPEVLGIIESSNRATITAAQFLFAQNILIPRLEFWRTQLQERFIGEYDERILLDYVSPVQEDKEHGLAVAIAAPWSLTVDEWRRKQGLTPLDGNRGEVFLVPFSLTPVKDFETDLIPEPSLGGGDDVPPGDGPPPAGKDAQDRWARALLPWRQALVADARVFREAGDLDAERFTLRRAVDVGAEGAIQALASKLEGKARRVFLQAVTEARGVIDVQELANLLQAGLIDQAAAAAGIEQMRAALGPMTDVLKTGFAAGGEFAAEALVAAGLEISFDLTNPRAREWAGRYSSQLITEVTDATRTGVRSLIELAFDEGMHPYQTARRIQEWVGLTSRQQSSVTSFTRKLLEDGIDPEVAERRANRYAQAQLRYRSQTIARTETLASANHGQDELWTQAREAGLLNPSRTQRVWIVTEDDRLDTATCEPMADQKVGLHQPFKTPQGKSVMVPPAHPNCRCAVGLEIT